MQLRNKAGKKNLIRFFYLILILVGWQALFSARLFSPILFPSPGEVLSTLIREIRDGSMLVKTGFSLYLIFLGLVISTGITLVLSLLLVISEIIRDFVKTLISILDPLPGIALLPIAILWFGIGRNAILFVMIHSILWPILLNVMTGFDTVPLIYREVGQSIGLKKVRMITGIYVPAAFPSILSGFKTGWARAWRALISAEMVFGATGLIGGLGWDIYTKRSYLDMPGMFASLIVIMVIGVVMEDLVFKRVEKATIVKWGMSR